MQVRSCKKDLSNYKESNGCISPLPTPRILYMLVGGQFSVENKWATSFQQDPAQSIYSLSLDSYDDDSFLWLGG